jgi:hypothetical protein
MMKKISHPHSHADAALSPHVDTTRSYPLSLSLDLSPSLSRRSTWMRFSKVSVEHEVGVAPDGVVEGWVVVERKVALPPPPRRVARGIRLLHQGGDLLLHCGCLISSPPSWPISSPLSSARVPPSGPLHRRHHHVQVMSSCLGAALSLSLPPLISALVHCARCHVPWHADDGALLELMEDVEIWKVMSEYATTPVSSGGSGSSGLKRDGGGARQRSRRSR